MIFNPVPEIREVINGHNARVFSGLEQIFIVQLSAAEKVSLISKIYSGVYKSNKFIVSKLAINDLTTMGYLEADLESEAETDAELEKYLTIFDDVFVVPIDPKKSKFNCKTQGDFKSRTYISEVTASVKGAGRLSVEFFNAFLNTEIALIFKDANGNFRLLFDPVYSVEMDVEQDSGEGLASDVGFTLTFSNQSKIPPIFVYGKFDVVGQILHTESGIEHQKHVTVCTAPMPSSFTSSTNWVEENDISGSSIESGI